jgi:hypothetical protein
MSIRPCSLCKQRVPGKLATSYNAWFLADGKRICYRQRLCLPCLTTTFGTILRNSNSTSTDTATCPACGGSSETDSDPVFITLYLPKQDPREYELDLDAACAAKTRGAMQDGGELLADRQAQGEGPQAPQPSPWDDLEL